MDDWNKPLSIKDIAAISGVSIATVSRVLNHKGGYSAETEKKVMAIANSYGYVSNMAAKTLRESRSRTIGLILPTVDNSFFSMLAYHIESYLYNQNYSVFICNSGNQAQKEKNYFKTLASKSVDGILCVSGLNELSEDIFRWNIPIVCIDRQPDTYKPAPWVGNDDFGAGYMMAEHLIEKGCKNILFVSSYLSAYAKKLRLRGYMSALEKHGLRFDKNYLLERVGSDPTQIESEILVHQFLNEGYPIDGVITTSELSALGALYALKGKGLSVPRDVRIVTFDNTLYSLFTSPQFTSIERNPEKMALESCKALLALIDGREPESYRISIPVSLMERESSR